MAEIMTVLSVLAIPWVTTAARARTPLSSELPNERFTFGGSEIEANAASSDAADVSPWRRVSSNLRCRDERRATRASSKLKRHGWGVESGTGGGEEGGERSPGRAENCFSYFIKSAVHFSSSLDQERERERERGRVGGKEGGREEGRERDADGVGGSASLSTADGMNIKWRRRGSPRRTSGEGEEQGGRAAEEKKDSEGERDGSPRRAGRRRFSSRDGGRKNPARTPAR